MRRSLPIGGISGLTGYSGGMDPHRSLRFITTRGVRVPGESGYLASGSQVLFNGTSITFRSKGRDVIKPGVISQGMLAVLKPPYQIPDRIMDLTLDPACLVGKVVRDAVLRHDTLTLSFADGCEVVAEHLPSCCEGVVLCDVWGDPQDLVGGTIVVFDVRRSHPDHTSAVKPTKTSTFYEIRTTRGDLTLRWGQPDDDESMYGVEITLSVLMWVW